MAALKITLAVSFTLAVCIRLSIAYPSAYSYHDFHQVEDESDDHHGPPSPYHFGYAVKDTHTNDIKTHQETSDGHGTVTGSYSLVEPDGSTRLVEYTADHIHGFQAKVKKIPPVYHHEESTYQEPIIHSYPTTYHQSYYQ
ncbi:larval cuticle protein A2B-like [Daktulosphaira vitifoliae]|uniref:larval cuticle protein A2B-like n=1 Tax=Daktulosphaira vitifoliae TaxID=58002 RepID=UPI0021AAD4F6|nr:larval cuticle protein A2B-like [Daktulosphaira vitifoliae]